MDSAKFMRPQDDAARRDWICNRNIAHFRKLLASTTGAKERAVLITLIAEQIEAMRGGKIPAQGH